MIAVLVLQIMLAVSNYARAIAVNGPTPVRLIVPYNTTAQYCCSGNFSDVDLLLSVFWSWNVNGATYTERNTLMNSNINITDSTHGNIDATKINYNIEDQAFLNFSCNVALTILEDDSVENVNVEGSIGEMISFGKKEAYIHAIHCVIILQL